MKKFIIVLLTTLVLNSLLISIAFAADAVKPKIQLEMSDSGAQSNIIIKVQEPADNYIYKFNYSVDGGYSWVIGGEGNSLTEDGSTGLFSGNFLADKYKNYLIRVIASNTVAGLTPTTSYSMAYPPNPSGHSNYSANTNLCKNCHTTHTAVGKKLLAKTSIENLCVECHGSTAKGAKYLVVAGKQVINSVYNTVDSLGGGFDRPGNTITSRHYYKDADPAAAPPGGKTGEPAIQMTCVKCHQGHAANDSASYNYRILKTSVNENAYNYNTTVVGLFAKTSSLDGADVYATRDTADTYIPLAAGISNFCGSCHNDFNVTGIGESDSPANNIKTTTQNTVTPSSVYQAVYYRHPIDVTLDTLTAGNKIDSAAVTLPLFSKKVTCLTCHKAHGTTAVQDDTSKSYLLRLNNRAVCENCHQK